ncbi:MAG: VanZ family protein [Methylococcaceae bacterium]|nr:VanZ family protein [Methylococcaceae bacterium]
MIIAAIVWLSLTPSPPQPPKLLNWDKMQHLVAYGSAAFWFGSVFKRHILWPMFLVALGIALEFLQDLGGVRTLEVADMIANSLGVAVGWWGSASPAGRWMAWLEGKLLGHGGT